MVYREEPGRLPAGILALLVHVLFFGLLVFGVQWQNKEPAAVTVDLWDSLPAVAPPVQQPVPEPKRVEPVPVKPPPKAAPEPKRAVEKPDIALQQKVKKHQEELKQAELKQQELKLQQQIQAEQKRQVDQQLQQQVLQQQILAQHASAQARLVGEYKDRIMAKIKRFVILPPDLAGNPQAEFDVVLLPGGDVLSVKSTRSSGQPAYDSAVERAIYKAAPLPLPPDSALFREFRELHLKFRPNE
jgi:colicin import membrane protein